MGNNLLLLDENNIAVETPLLPPQSTYYSHQQNNAVYPYNLTAFQGSVVASSTLNNFLIDSSNANGQGMVLFFYFKLYSKILIIIIKVQCISMFSEVLRVNNNINTGTCLLWQPKK